MLRSFEIFIKDSQSDRLVEENEILWDALQKEKLWIREKGKSATLHEIQKRSSNIKRQVRF